MAEQRIWTAAEVEKMTPAEREDLFRASLVTDPALVPEHLLERARRKMDERIAAAEGEDVRR